MTSSKLKVCLKCGVILHARGMGNHVKRCKGEGVKGAPHLSAQAEGITREVLTHELQR